MELFLTDDRLDQQNDPHYKQCQNEQYTNNLNQAFAKLKEQFSKLQWESIKQNFLNDTAGQLLANQLQKELEATSLSTIDLAEKTELYATLDQLYAILQAAGDKNGNKQKIIKSLLSLFETRKTVLSDVDTIYYNDTDTPAYQLCMAVVDLICPEQKNQIKENFFSPKSNLLLDELLDDDDELEFELNRLTDELISDFRPEENDSFVQPTYKVLVNCKNNLRQDRLAQYELLSDNDDSDDKELIASLPDEVYSSTYQPKPLLKKSFQTLEENFSDLQEEFEKDKLKRDKLTREALFNEQYLSQLISLIEESILPIFKKVDELLEAEKIELYAVLDALYHIVKSAECYNSNAEPIRLKFSNLFRLREQVLLDIDKNYYLNPNSLSRQVCVAVADVVCPQWAQENKEQKQFIWQDSTPPNLQQNSMTLEQLRQGVVAAEGRRSKMSDNYCFLPPTYFDLAQSKIKFMIRQVLKADKKDKYQDAKDIISKITTFKNKEELDHVYLLLKDKQYDYLRTQKYSRYYAINDKGEREQTSRTFAIIEKAYALKRVSLELQEGQIDLKLLQNNRHIGNCRYGKSHRFFPESNTAGIVRKAVEILDKKLEKGKEKKALAELQEEINDQMYKAKRLEM